MKGISSLQELMRHKDFFVTIDSKDAYLTVPIHPVDRKFFRIHWSGGGRFVSILMASLRSFLCPLDFHQNFETNCNLFKETRTSFDYLARRYSHIKFKRGRGREKLFI